MKKLAGCLIAVVGVIGTPALAADMAAKMPLKAPPPAAPLFSWTGCYLGANVGGAWQRNHWVVVSDTPGDEGGADRGSGVIGGAQLGCDYQLATNWVVGVQGMVDWTSIDSSHLFPDSTETLGTKTKWVDTLTGRIGYAIWPQILLYFKGGGAWARIDYSDADPFHAPPYLGLASVTRSGWTVGGGVEYAFMPNWSAFAEYNFIDLGNRNVSLIYNCGTTATCGFSNPFTYTISHNISEFLVGINYRFGSLPGHW